MKDIAVIALVAFSVLGAFLSGLGLVSAKTSFDRLHYLSSAVIVMPVPLTLAIILQNGFSAQASIETLLLATILLATSPVTTHALGRAWRAREDGDLRARSTDDVIS